MSEKKHIWLTLGQDVFVDILHGVGVMLYNTCRGNYFFSEEKEILDIVEKLYLPENLGVIPYKKSYDGVTDKAINDGFLSICIRNNSIKPIKLLPQLSLQKDLERNVEEKNIDEALSRLGNKLYYLSGLYVSLDCGISQDDVCAKYRNVAAMQYPCVRYEQKYIKIVPKYLEDIFNKVKKSSIAVVDLVCSHQYFLGNELNALLDVLSKYNFQYRIHIYVEEYALMSRMLVCKLSKYCQFIIYRDKFTPKKLVEKVSCCESVSSLRKLCYDDFSIAEVGGAIIMPVVMDNMNQTVWEGMTITNSDLCNPPRSMHYLFKNQKLNSNFFGILCVSNHGDVYTPASMYKLGNIYKDYSFVRMITTEFKENHSWRITRDKIPRCNGCPFRYVCPPVFSWELQYPELNICNVKF